MSKYFNLKIFLFSTFLSLVILCSGLLFVSCKNSEPKNIKLYVTETKQIKTLAFNDYLAGVVAAEIGNDAPLEALKAQAVMARTFALKFLKTSKSKYNGAEISNDINEAQAYNEKYINDNIRKAVKETKGVTVKYNDEYIDAYFHSNSGGRTANAKEGFNYLGDGYEYLKSVQTSDSDSNTKNFSFSCTFTKNEILNALRNMGVNVASISTFKKGEIGESGRCLTFIVGGKEISANTFRLNIGSTKLKSTLISSITVNESSVTFKGQGYGHGVGLSQETSINLAKEGKNYNQIISYFFDNVKIS